MTIKFTYINERGILSVVHPVEGLEQLTEDRLTAKGIDYTAVEENDIPSNRVFRDAWEMTGKNINVSLTKSKVLHMGRLRILRDKQLQSLDVEYIKALELENATKLQSIKETKKLLRDMPDTESLNGLTIKQLETYKPDYLEGDF